MGVNLVVDTKFEAFTGQTSTDAAYLISLLDSLITEKGGNGAFFESGTYYGKSAAIFLAQQSVARGILVDQADYIELDRLIALFPEKNISFTKERSEVFLDKIFDNLLGSDKLVFSHLDASHYFSNVTTEILKVIPKMMDIGLICLDDWSDTYPQVRAAYYHIHYCLDQPWELLATGFNKAFLCHKNHFNTWSNFLIQAFTQDALVINQKEVYWQLSRTDFSKHSRSFHIRKRKQEDPNLYGQNIWQDRFYKLNIE